MMEVRFSDNDPTFKWISEFMIKNQNPSYQLPECEDSLWVFWSDPTSSSWNPNSVYIDASTRDCIKYALQTFKLYYKHCNILIQYWALTSTTIGGRRCLLTTSNQPFALSQIDHKLLDYRMCSLDYEYIMDGSESEQGHLGRVFLQRLPELTPNVEYYSSEEYPQRQDALRCHIQWLLALPVFEPSGQCCVGVLELVSTDAKYFICIYDVFCSALEKVGLRSFIPCKPLSDELVCKEGLKKAIKEVLKAACKKHHLPLAQTWHSRCGGEFMSILPGAYYISERYAGNFQFYTGRLPLKKGQGVVGRAYMSRNACFCGDVTQLSMADYPFAHWARYFGLASCFAICLRTSEYTTPDFDYVLEFFFPPGKTYGGGDQRTLLNSLLATMEQHFPSFKIASGKDLGEELDVDFRMVGDSFPICQTSRSPPKPEPFHNVGDMLQLYSSDQFVDFRMVGDAFPICQTSRSPPKPEPFHDIGDMLQLHSSDQFVDFLMVGDSFPICQTSRSPPKPEPFHDAGDMMQLHSFHPQLMVEDDDAIQNERNVVSETAVTNSEKQGTIEIPETRHRTSISYEVLKQHFGRKLEDAAEHLRVSRSTLKHICRQHGVIRWPSHKRNKNNPHLPPEQAVASTARTMPHEKAMQGVSTVTIKAKYSIDTIKFQLSSLSTMIELEEKVSHRLKLNVGSFKIMYKDDDDDWILITCNEDLRDCITTSASLGNTTIRMLVQPNTD